jgi:hypothetical protein
MWKILPQINFITRYKKELITYSKNVISLAGYITVTTLRFQRETWRGTQ